MKNRLVANIAGLGGCLIWLLGLLGGAVNYGAVHSCYLGAIIFLLLHQITEASHD